MKMKKIVPFLAFMISLAGPLAYADGRDNEKDKGAATTTTQPAAQNNSQSESAPNEENPCPATQDTKQDNKHKAKPAPSDQEREFDRVLMGIYG